MALLLRIHRQPFRPLVKVPTIGELSSVSHALIGMALAGAGYHIVVHALGLPQFRGPLGMALIVAGIVIVCTILADSFDEAAGISVDQPRASDEDDGPADEATASFREPEKWDKRA